MLLKISVFPVQFNALVFPLSRVLLKCYLRFELITITDACLTVQENDLKFSEFSSFLNFPYTLLTRNLVLSYIYIFDITKLSLN